MSVLSHSIYQFKESSKDPLQLKAILAEIDETADTLERVITHLPKASQKILKQQTRGWNEWVKAISSDPLLQTDPEQAFALEVYSLARLASYAHDRIEGMKIAGHSPQEVIDGAIKEVEEKIASLKQLAGDDQAKLQQINTAIISWRPYYPAPKP